MLKHIVRSLVVSSILAAGAALAQGDSHAPGSTPDRAAGSRISLERLAPIQVDNLVVLGKVWGFLKYHHPVVTGGQRQWDAELLNVLPALLAAPNRDRADAVLHRWIAGLGPVTECHSCAGLDKQDFQLLPKLDWLDSPRLLGPTQQKDLANIYRNRSGQQFYVALAPQVNNPVFINEPDYKDAGFPDAGLQLLSLFRLWNIVEYWSPYRDEIGEDWDKVLRESIASVALAKDRSAYELAMIAVVARIHDTHTNLWSSLHVRPPVGMCWLPVVTRFVEARAVVSAYSDEEAGAASGLKRGDIIEAIDGVPVAQLIDSWRPYYAASNEPTRLRDIGEGLGRGACGPARLKIRQGGQSKEIAASWLPRSGPKPPRTHDRPGDTFQLLDNDIAYLKLSSIKRADVPGYMERAAHTKGMIIDIRNYPSEFVVWHLGPYFLDRPTSFVRFTTGDLGNPGGFKWTNALDLRPHPQPYAGKLMILVDELSQSQSEYTAMALRAGPRAKVVGSTTAGADGNASWFSLPGGLRSMISGIGVFYPDKRPTQRIGILPDIEVRPTIEGIRAGRDEVLDAAIAEIRKD